MRWTEIPPFLGAFADDDDGSLSGSAYVYVRNTGGADCPLSGDPDPWCEQAKLTASDGGVGDWFGYGVAVSGDTVAVAARRDDNGTAFFRPGSVYIFERSGTTWTETAKFQADDLSANPWFGSHVALEADTLVVGARKDDEKETDPGVRAVLGHFVFVYIHPYLDGNGRIARFLMNIMLASGGYPWTVIPVDKRDEYMASLEAASVRNDIAAFAQLLSKLVQSRIDGAAPPGIPGS